MSKKDNNRPFRISSPPADVRRYVNGRCKKHLRSIPNDLIIIIREHKEFNKKSGK